MKTLLSPLIAATLAASFAVAAPIPAEAAPVYVPNAEQARTDAEPVKSRHWRWQQERRADRRAWRRYAWRERCWRWGDCPDYSQRYYGFSPRRHYHRRDYYPRDYYRRDYYRQGGVTLEFNF
jgi:hypothetical protein